MIYLEQIPPSIFILAQETYSFHLENYTTAASALKQDTDIPTVHLGLEATSFPELVLFYHGLRPSLLMRASIPRKRSNSQYVENLTG